MHVAVEGYSGSQASAQPQQPNFQVPQAETKGKVQHTLGRRCHRSHAKLVAHRKRLVVYLQGASVKKNAELHEEASRRDGTRYTMLRLPSMLQPPEPPQPRSCSAPEPSRRALPIAAHPPRGAQAKRDPIAQSWIMYHKDSFA